MAVVLKADQTAVQAARDLVAAMSRLRRRLRDVAGTDELTPSQTSVLGVLAKAGPATASGLAATEGVRPQSMAATLAPLEGRGLVRREADPSDGRRQLVTLTRAGHDWFNGHRAARQEWLIGAVSEQLTDAERRTLIKAAALMQRVTDA
jgi:DNA-binding MarR family transcriptional regulator